MTVRSKAAFLLELLVFLNLAIFGTKELWKALA